MLSTTAIGLRLTTSSAQAMLSYLTTQQVLSPPLKINPAFASNYTGFSLVSRAISGHPAHKHTFFHETQQTLGTLHQAFAERIFAVWFFLGGRVSLSVQPNLHRLCKKTEFSDEDLTEEC